ncbi:MAG: histidine kinase [Bacteroidales bacterium]|nr:histidine kinase [Bacteroidales bacterium]
MIKVKQGFLIQSYKTFLFHGLAWLLFFLLSFLTISNYRINVDFWFHFKVWILYIIVFYINYMLFIPGLLFRKKLFLYVLCSLVLIFGIFFLKSQFENNHFEKLKPARFERSFDELRKAFPEINKDFIRKEGEISRPFNKKIFDGRRMLFSSYGILLIFLSSTVLRLLLKWSEDEKIKSETEKENIAAELSYLKKQVNPHFLFNSLNSIYSLSISKSEKTTDTILKLSSILRYMLYETNSKLVYFSEELEVIHNYIELQKLRLTDKVSVNYTLKGNPDSFKIEPLLLIPLIENAFKYGTDNVNNSFIDIQINITDKRLSFDVRNKKVFSPKKNNENASGIGIKNINRRLELLYPGDYKLNINDGQDLYHVHLTLYLKQ